MDKRTVQFRWSAPARTDRWRQWGFTKDSRAAMPDNTTTLAVLKEAVRHFAAERAWEPFHTPKNLSMGVAVEAAELMEQFIWVEGEASRAIVHDPDWLAAVTDEVADVACHLLTLSNT